ncbi:MAG TPA: site-specific DNA-methyltransferase [bacterium]|nr:site-specific DNA-methyltransferase [bacterium]
MSAGAKNNRTIRLTEAEESKYDAKLARIDAPATVEDACGRVFNMDVFDALPLLPEEFVDLCFVDPPYNMNKTFNAAAFKRRADEQYAGWMESWLAPLARLLKKNASIYVCSDWKSSAAAQRALEKFFIIRNRITWEREKGRGAKNNWKNCHEDIWFCTVGEDYYFDVNAVKVKRRTLAPYTKNGAPKDWSEDAAGRFRLTHPSNLWNDLTVPFWSMPENTCHPTQKPEKMLAKIILASSRPGAMVFDPFLGSGTTAVAAKKLGRDFCGVEMDAGFARLAAKRLDMAESDSRIQGFDDGIFKERNS